MSELTQTKQKRSHYLAILSMTCVTLWAVCLMGQDRLVSVYSGYVAATIFVYPFVCCVFDIIAEIYGYKTARKTLWSSLALIYVFAILMSLFSKLPAPIFWAHYTTDFNTAVHPLLRIIIVASVAIIIGQYINIYLISRWYFLTKGKHFILRSIGSTIVGDSITFMLSIWGFFVGSMSWHQIATIVVDELAIMYGMAVLLAFPASVIVSLLKNREPEYQAMSQYNPFTQQ